MLAIDSFPEGHSGQSRGLMVGRAVLARNRSPAGLSPLSKWRVRTESDPATRRNRNSLALCW
jgi:hypothetical protein